MKLTKSNYYSAEANEAYWSASQVKQFLECPSRAMAELRGEYVRPESTALLVGSYVDSYFEGPKSFGSFVQTHPEILKRDGTLKAEYVRADEMIQSATSDPVFVEFMQGRKQVIKTGVIAGVPFKAKFDVLKTGERIVDLKTCKDFEPVYKVGEGRLDFASAYNYPLQMAIYQRLEGHRLPCYLACITKEPVPDKVIIQIPQERMDAEMEFLESIMPRLDAIKHGIIEPDGCGHCDWCKSTKKLTGPIGLYEFVEGGL